MSGNRAIMTLKPEMVSQSPSLKSRSFQSLTAKLWCPTLKGIVSTDRSYFESYFLPVWIVAPSTLDWKWTARPKYGGCGRLFTPHVSQSYMDYVFFVTEVLVSNEVGSSPFGSWGQQSQYHCQLNLWNVWHMSLNIKTS